MYSKYPFDPMEAYDLPNTIKDRILKALYGESEKTVNAAEKDISDCISERTALLQLAADILTARQRPICEFDMRYAMMWAYWKASDSFEADPSLKNALILCSVSVCETILKAHDYMLAKEDTFDGD